MIPLGALFCFGGAAVGLTVEPLGPVPTLGLVLVVPWDALGVPAEIPPGTALDIPGDAAAGLFIERPAGLFTG